MSKIISYRKPQSVETTELCKYGCGRVAKFKTSGGDYICDSSPNKCTALREKNSKGIEKAHDEGRIPGWNKIPNLNRGWAKGLSKDTDERVSKFATTLKERYASGDITPSFLGKNHSDKTKKHLSEKRVEYLEKNHNHGIMWYTVDGKRVQGTWEKLVAEKLTSLGILWERKKLSYNTRTYTPDFYLVEYDLYIEVKGFMRERDKAKMHNVLDEHIIDIRLIESLETIENITSDNITSLAIFKDKYLKDKIDYSLFKNHWV